MIFSKYKPFQISITIFFSVLFIFIGPIVLLSKSALSDKDYLGISLVFFLGIYLILSFFNKSPRIAFDEHNIKIKHLFKSYEYSWDQVSNVFLSKKEFYSVLFILGQTLEGMKLIFTDGRALVVWGDMYSNMNEMRALVTHKLNDRLHFLVKKEKSLNYLFIEKKYSGNALLSFNTLLIIGMIIFFLIKLNGFHGKEWLLVLPIAFILILYIAFGTQMNFFEINSDELIVKNHYFPWKKISYNVNDIEQVSTETPYRRSKGLRIITNDFQSKFFGAGSLRDAKWRELLDDVNSLGIKNNND